MGGMKISVVIPCHNEEGSLRGTVDALIGRLDAEGFPLLVFYNEPADPGAGHL